MPREDSTTRLYNYLQDKQRNVQIRANTLISIIDQFIADERSPLRNIEDFVEKNDGNEEAAFLRESLEEDLSEIHQAKSDLMPVVVVFIQSHLENNLKRLGIMGCVKLTTKPDKQNTIDWILDNLSITDKSLVPGYEDCMECWNIANGIKHGYGKSKKSVRLNDGESVAVGHEIDYAELRCADYAKSASDLLLYTLTIAQQKKQERLSKPKP